MAGVPLAKLVAPVRARDIGRPRLDGLVAEALARRLTLVMGPAGSGKSSIAAAWAATTPTVWYTLDEGDRALGTLARGLAHAVGHAAPAAAVTLEHVREGAWGPEADEAVRADAMAAVLVEALAAAGGEALLVVLDDVQAIDAAPAAIRLVEGLCRLAPPTAHVVVLSRRQLPFSVTRLRGRGDVFDIGADHLAFTGEEVRHLVETMIECPAPGLAEAVHQFTAGWPAAVRLAVEMARRAPPPESAGMTVWTRPSQALVTYLAEEVLAAEPAAIRELLRRVALLDRFTSGLCAALGVGDAAAELPSLAGRGLVVELGAPAGPWYALHQLVRQVVVQQLQVEPDERAALLLQASGWLEANGQVEEALGVLVEAGDHARLARFLDANGLVLVAAGAVDAVVRAGALLDVHATGAAIAQVVGQAFQVQGDWENALRAYGDLATGGSSLSAGLAWRIGLIHYMRGDGAEALRVFDRGQVDAGNPFDEAMLLAWTVTAHWLRGDGETCRRLVPATMAAAERSGSAQAMAAAHTARALLAALEGDRQANADHYARALESAEAAGDMLQAIRIRTNLGSQLIEEGRFHDGLIALEPAVHMARVTGFATSLAIALGNRAQALLRLGRMEEAVADFDQARAIHQRLSSSRAAYALHGLGDVYRERGDLALARAAYEEAVGRAESAEDTHGLVPSLSGLARVVAADDLDAAAALAERALAAPESVFRVSALLARGWVALLAGDHHRACSAADEALTLARNRRDRAGLAEALELHGLADAAATGADPRSARTAIEQALAVWRDTGDPIGQARAELALARLDAGPTGRLAARRAERNLRHLGVRPQSALAAGLLAAVGRDDVAPAAIEALGGFRVLRQGQPVALTEWQSKKARDLLKLLVARRGRPVPRDVLMDTLWPDEDPARVANRLSVALSTVRSVLDPQRRFGPDHFVVADKQTVGLDLRHLDVDIERFLLGVATGRALALEDRPDDALDVWTDAEATYAGEFLAGDPYEDWAVPTRDEARAAYVVVARALAELSAAARDADGAGRYLLRILEQDPYDEQAHLAMVSVLTDGGRHGEADRSYRSYVARMADLGVEPAPRPKPGARVRRATFVNGAAGARRDGGAPR